MPMPVPTSHRRAHRRFVVMLTATLGPFGVLACSDDSSDEPASTAAPLPPCDPGGDCGGDIEGTWQVDSYCVEYTGPAYTIGAQGGIPAPCASDYDAALPTLQYEPVDYTFDFDGGDYRQSGAVRSSITYRYGEACFRAYTQRSLTDESCATFGARLDEDPDGTASCEHVGASCVCTVGATQPIDEAGSYQVSGAGISFDDYGIAGSYCVSGSTAVLDFSLTAEVVTRFRLRRDGQPSLDGSIPGDAGAL